MTAALSPQCPIFLPLHEPQYIICHCAQSRLENQCVLKMLNNQVNVLSNNLH